MSSYYIHLEDRVKVRLMLRWHFKKTIPGLYPCWYESKVTKMSTYFDSVHQVPAKQKHAKWLFHGINWFVWYPFFKREKSKHHIRQVSEETLVCLKIIFLLSFECKRRWLKVNNNKTYKPWLSVSRSKQLCTEACCGSQTPATTREGIMIMRTRMVAP